MDDNEIYDAIAEAVDEYYKDDGYEDITIRAGVYKKLYEISGNKDYGYEFDRLCEKYKVCPCCVFGRMERIVVGRDRHEYWGETCYEDVVEWVCDECGAVK